MQMCHLFTLISNTSPIFCARLESLSSDKIVFRLKSINNRVLLKPLTLYPMNTNKGGGEESEVGNGVYGKSLYIDKV